MIKLLENMLLHDIKLKNNEILINAGFDITEEQLENILKMKEKKIFI